jgi:Glycosyl-4,4'-diaponeurosporenoate acyltransferase
MIRSTHNPEADHLLIFVATIGITLWATVSGWWSTVAWLLLFNLLHNVYPMLSMRQLRARLARH